MNHIDELFEQKTSSVLSVYFTAGYPELTDTAAIISGLEDAGAGLVEIGFPFSDPVADGPVIQASSHQSLVNGMNLDILFDQLRDIRATSHIPKILMGYFNTVYQYGVERFTEQCAACGISGAIIPDLPPEVYDRDYRDLFEEAGIHFICLIAPQTGPERARYLASLSRGFLYVLSSSSTTGSPAREGLNALRVFGSLSTLPTLIGFGIHDHETFKIACRQANGAIIGTAFIRFLAEGLEGQAARTAKGDGRIELIHNLCEEFIHQIRGKP